MKTIINPYNWLYDWFTKRMLQFSKRTPLVGEQMHKLFKWMSEPFEWMLRYFERMLMYFQWICKPFEWFVERFEWIFLGICMDDEWITNGLLV